MAVLVLVVYRLIIQGWLDRIMPYVAASTVAWLLTGTLVALTLTSIVGELRQARRPATA
jgi:hypothetical protein